MDFATLAPLQSEQSLMNAHCVVTHAVPLSEKAFHTCVPLGSTGRIQEQSLLSSNSPLPYLRSLWSWNQKAWDYSFQNMNLGIVLPICDRSDNSSFLSREWRDDMIPLQKFCKKLDYFKKELK